MSLTPEPITIQRSVQTKDAAGGNSIVWQTVYSGMATRTFYRSQGWNMQLSEEGTHNAAGAGVVTAARQFLCFEAADPGARPMDRAIVGDGSVWLVLYSRDYTDEYAINIQVDLASIDTDPQAVA